MNKAKSRFDKKWVEGRNGCWEWQASKDGKGYSRFSMNCKSIYGHRASWIIYRGDIPDGSVIRHGCDNPSCVNPDHLSLGSQADNMRDRDSRGRGYAGERNHLSKLTLDQVSQIRNMYEEGEYIQTAIAGMFQVTPSAVSRIVRGVNWRNAETT